MKLKIELGTDELNVMVIEHLKKKLGIEIEAEDIYWQNYGGCEIGRYSGLHVPPKPKKAAPSPDPVPTNSEAATAEIAAPAATETPSEACKSIPVPF